MRSAGTGMSPRSGPTLELTTRCFIDALAAQGAKPLNTELAEALAEKP